MGFQYRGFEENSKQLVKICLGYVGPTIPNTNVYIRPLGGIHAMCIIFVGPISHIHLLFKSPKLDVLTLTHESLTNFSSFTCSNTQKVLSEISCVTVNLVHVRPLIDINPKAYKCIFNFVKPDLPEELINANENLIKEITDH